MNQYDSRRVTCSKVVPLKRPRSTSEEIDALQALQIQVGMWLNGNHLNEQQKDNARQTLAGIEKRLEELCRKSGHSYQINRPVRFQKRYQ